MNKESEEIEKTREDKYAQDGVDVKEGDSFSEFAGALCRQTYNNSPFVEVKDFSRGHFRGPRGFRLKNLPEDFWLDAAPDGEGTKVILVDAAGNYQYAAYGLVAMTSGDITRWGGVPLVVVNNLDVSKLGKYGDEVNRDFRTMMLGLKKVADEERLVMFKGETAELGPCVGSENEKALTKYLWSGTAIGAYNPKTIITGDNLKEGMVVMALREYGFRNNGISSVRKALKMAYGNNYCTNPQGRRAIKEAARPAVLYDNFLAYVNGWYNKENNFQPLVPMHLVVHLTGGSFKSKLAEDILFPRGFSADLNNLWIPPEIMKKCANWHNMSDRECYEIWNGGQGVLVVLEDNACHIEKFLDLAQIFNIEVKKVGKITKEVSPRVIIESKFRGDTVTFSPK